MRSRIRLQPIINLDNEKVFGYEALYRKSYRGRYPSAINILKNIAECTHNYKNDFRFFINLTFNDLTKKDFNNQIMNILDQHQINPARVTFEICENTPPDTIDIALNNLKLLKKNNMNIALDDFGLSHSVLNFTKDIPLDFVKIDQAFVQGAVSNARTFKIMQSLINVAKESADIIAEGIETVEQLECVKSLGVTKGQGFLFHTNSGDCFVQLENLLRKETEERKLAA